MQDYLSDDANGLNMLLLLTILLDFRDLFSLNILEILDYNDTAILFESCKIHRASVPNAGFPTCAIIQINPALIAADSFLFEVSAQLQYS